MAMADRIAVMNEGNIEQLDVPDKLYDAPATPFVAEFIGDMSVLSGTLEGDEVALGGGGRVPIGRRLANAHNGAAVRLGIRPEAATIGPPENGGVAATVVTAMVLGDRLQMVLQLADGDELLLRQVRSGDDRVTAAVRPHDRVGVRFAPGAGLLIGEAGAATPNTMDQTVEEAVTS